MAATPEVFQLTLHLDVPDKSDSLKIASNATVAQLISEAAKNLGVKELKTHDFRCIAFAADVKLLSPVDQVSHSFVYYWKILFLTQFCAANTGVRWHPQQINNSCQCACQCKAGTGENKTNESECSAKNSRIETR